jgi:hypothetical protein
VAEMSQNRVKPLNNNNKIRKLEGMQELRRLLVQGDSPADIQIKLNLSPRTYYRWLNSVFSKDIEVLRKINEREILTQCALLKDRLNDVYMTLDEMSKNTELDAEARISACITRANIARSIPKLFSEGPSFIALQEKKREEATAKSMMQRLEEGWRSQMAEQNSSGFDATNTAFRRNMHDATDDDADSEEKEQREEEDGEAAKKEDWWTK